MATRFCWSRWTLRKRPPAIFTDGGAVFTGSIIEHYYHEPRCNHHPLAETQSFPMPYRPTPHLSSQGIRKDQGNMRKKIHETNIDQFAHFPVLWWHSLPSQSLLRIIFPEVQIVDLGLKGCDLLFGCRDGGFTPVSVFLLPPLDAVLLLSDAVIFGLKLAAQLALLFHDVRRHNELHAASLTGSILSGAMLSEVAPFEAAAGHFVLIVVAHIGESYRRTKIVSV